MFNILFGVSITLNIVLIVGIFMYFKIKALGTKKVLKELSDKFFCFDEELDDMLDSL